jgi:hypothetical protein
VTLRGYRQCPGIVVRGNEEKYGKPRDTRSPNRDFDRGGPEVEVKIRPPVSRPVSHSVRPPSGTRDQFFFLLEIFFRQVRVCYFVAASPTRGRVCNLLLLLVLTSTVLLGSESRGTQDHILLSQFLRLPHLEGQVPVFISPRNRVAQLYPRALGSLSVVSYDSQGYGGGILSRLHTGWGVC